MPEADREKRLRTQARTRNIYHADEYVEKLEDLDARIKAYTIIRKSDSQVGGLLRVIKLPIREVEWEVKDGKEEIRKFVEDNIKSDLHGSWDDFIRLALTMLDFGFCVFEKVFMYDRGTQKYKWKKFVYLPQPTIKEIVGEQDGGLKKITQYSATDTELGEALQETIDIGSDYLLVFTNEKEGDWYGTSLFRNIYGNAQIKDVLMKIDAIKHDRFGVGIPWMRLKQGYKKEDLALAEGTMKRMRAHEYSYMLIPPGAEDPQLLMMTGNDGTAVLKSIQYHDEQMSKSLLAQFLDLGTSQSGNRALGESFINLFLMSLNGITKQIEETFNQYAIKQLVDINFGLQKEYPRLEAGQITLNKIMDFAESLEKLTNAKWLKPMAKDQNQIRNELGLTPLDDEELEKIEQQRQQIPPTPPQGTQPPGQPAPGSPPQATASEGYLKPGDKYFRELVGIEKQIDFMEYAEKLENMKNEFIRKLKKIRDKQIRSLVYDIVDDGKPVGKIRPRYADLFEKEIQAYQERAFNMGVQTVQKEKKEQLSGRGYTEKNIKLYAFDQIPSDIFDMMEVNSAIGAEIISNRTKAHVTDLFVTYKNQGLSNKAIKANIFNDTIGTGEKVISSEFLRVVAMWAMAREVAAKQDEEVQGGFYSAVMDGTTCSACMDADISYNAGTQDQPFQLEELPGAPNPECEGGVNRCRCIHVYQYFRESGI